MTAEEKTARLNLVRYGMFLVVVMAMTITPISFFLAYAPLGEPMSRVLVPTLIATGLAALLAGVVYFAYSRYLDTL